MAEEAASRWAEMVIADAISAADRAAEDALSRTEVDRARCGVRGRTASRSPSREHNWPLDPIAESTAPEIAMQPHTVLHLEPKAKEASTLTCPCSHENPTHNDFIPDFRKARSASEERTRDQDCTRLGLKADLIEYRLSMLQLDIGQISNRIQQQSGGGAASIAAAVCSHIDKELTKMRRHHEQQVDQLSSLLRQALNMELPFPVEETTNDHSIAAVASAALNSPKATTMMPEPAQWDGTHAPSVAADASQSCGRLPMSTVAPPPRAREHQILSNCPWGPVQRDPGGLMSASQSQSLSHFDQDHPSAALHRRGRASAPLRLGGTCVDGGLNDGGSPTPPRIPHSTQVAGVKKSWLSPRNVFRVEGTQSPMSPRKSMPQHYRELAQELPGAAKQHVTLERPACRTGWPAPPMHRSQSSLEPVEARAARCTPMVSPPPMSPVISQCQTPVDVPNSTGHGRPSEQSSASVTCQPGHRCGMISVPLCRENPITMAEVSRKSLGAESMAQWLTNARVDGALRNAAVRGSPRMLVEETHVPPCDVGTSRRTLSPRRRDGAQTSGRPEWFEDSASPLQSREHSRASFAA
mmetsp:Transcript_43447/g.86218  ORF Transcript_43447/g.86218 Transcript_43447/m.86218 type:complete len:582 (-) Transcript_43447:235-1980(-)